MPTNLESYGMDRYNLAKLTQKQIKKLNNLLSIYMFGVIHEWNYLTKASYEENPKLDSQVNFSKHIKNRE